MAYGDRLSYGRKRRSSFQLNPRIVIVILVFVFLLLCLIGRGTFSSFGCQPDRSVEYKNYAAETKKVADQSTKLGQNFAALRNSMKDLSRKDLEAKMDGLIKDSAKVAEAGRKIAVPEGLETADVYFRITLDLRSTAFEKVKPAIFNALGDKDLEVSAKQVSLALRDMAFSDRAFELYRGALSEFLTKNKVAGVTAPLSVYLPAGTEFEMANVLDLLQSVKGSSSLSQLHGVAISELRLEPAAKSESGGVGKLPFTAAVSITVTVENQGNQVEVNVPVEVTLKSETQPTPQKKKKSIGSINPGQKKTITITDLKPTGGDIINLLTVSAGPVANEKFIDNNVLEYKFTVERK